VLPVRDILDTIRRRYPLVEVILAPTACKAMSANRYHCGVKSLNKRIHPDVILLARGGARLKICGPSTDERVARAIAASVAPVISGVVMRQTLPSLILSVTCALPSQPRGRAGDAKPRRSGDRRK